MAKRQRKGRFSLCSYRCPFLAADGFNSELAAPKVISYLNTGWSPTSASVPRSCCYLWGDYEVRYVQHWRTPQLTLNDDNTVSRVTAQAVGGCALVLPGVRRLAVDDLDGDDAVGVGDGELVSLERLAGLGP